MPAQSAHSTAFSFHFSAPPRALALLPPTSAVAAGEQGSDSAGSEGMDSSDQLPCLSLESGCPKASCLNWGSNPDLQAPADPWLQGGATLILAQEPGIPTSGRTLVLQL